MVIEKSDKRDVFDLGSYGCFMLADVMRLNAGARKVRVKRRTKFDEQTDGQRMIGPTFPSLFT